MDWNPEVIMHNFNYKVYPAINIKIYNLPLTREEQNIAYDIIGNEVLSQILWMDLGDIMDAYKADHILQTYTGGRSSGWLYCTNYDIESDHDLFVELAQSMFATLKERIANYLDEDHLCWGVDMGDKIEFHYYKHRVELIQKSVPIFKVAYDFPPTNTMDCLRLQGDMLIKYISTL